AGETGAGATVEIQLLNEYLAHARQGDDPSVQEWRRCQPGGSWRLGMSAFGGEGDIVRGKDDFPSLPKADISLVEIPQCSAPRSPVRRHLKLKLVRRIKAGHMLLATAARLAKAREKRKNSCRFGVHAENPGYVYFLY